MRTPDFSREELKVLVPSLPFLYDWILVPQILQDALRKLFVDELIRQVTNDFRALDRQRVILPAFKPKELDIELIGKSLGPRKKLLRDIGL